MNTYEIEQLQVISVSTSIVEKLEKEDAFSLLNNLEQLYNLIIANNSDKTILSFQNEVLFHKLNNIFVMNCTSIYSMAYSSNTSQKTINTTFIKKVYAETKNRYNTKYNFNRYLTMRGDTFYYHNIPLDLNQKQRLYQVLFCIYKLSEGKTTVFKLKPLFRIMKQIYPKEFTGVGKTVDYLEGVVRGAILERGKGLRKIGYMIKDEEANGVPLFKSIRGEGGIKFNNGN